MSNRLTFSLASLILILVAGFALLIPSIVEADDLTIADPSDQEWVKGTGFNTITLGEASHTSHATDTFTYALAPALPAGVVFNPGTREISGTPSVGMAETTYTYTATGSPSGHTASQTFKISVASDVEFVVANYNALLETPDTAMSDTNRVVLNTYKAGSGLGSISFPKATDEDGDTIAYSITTGAADLAAAGFAVAGGNIVGQSTKASSTDITLTATSGGTDQVSDSSSSAPLQVMFVVVPDKKPALAEIKDISGTVGTAIDNVQLPIATNIDTGATVRYALNPTQPPAGLSLEEVVPGIWIISGTPTEATATTGVTYTWSATEVIDGVVDDTTSQTFTITITGPDTTPVAFASDATIPSQTYTAGTAIANLELPAAKSGTGTGALMYSLTDASGNAIGNGLMFTAATRMLSGTPTAAMAAQTYTYKVTDSATPATEASLTFMVTVNAAPLPPTATITTSNHVAATGNFDIRVQFVPATGESAVTGFDHTYLTVMDSSTPAQSAPIVVATGTTIDPPLMANNLYVATLDYDTRFNFTLPLKVSINQAILKTANPKHSADVGTGTTTPPVAKAKATFSGTLSLTGQSIIKVTLSKAAMLTAADFQVTGGNVVGVQAKAATATAPANTVWDVAIQADNDPFTKSIMVTIAATSTVAEPATVNGSLQTAVPKGTLSSITAAAGASDSAPFIVTFTFAAALPSGVSLTANDIKVTPATAKVGTPSADPLDRAKWYVAITPIKGMDTKIELSADGKLKFDGTATPLTVAGAPMIPAPGTSTVPAPHAHISTAPISLSSAGTIPANGFVVIARSASKAGILGGTVKEIGFVNLYNFFMNQGTISLHGPAAETTANPYGNIYNDVVISEIMWGLDNSLNVNEREYSQWIELYNTTKHPISLYGFELVFHGNRVADTAWWNASKRCIDVVGNAGAAERIVPKNLKLPSTLYGTDLVDGAAPWSVPGQSGHSIPGQPSPVTVDIISMSRDINYNRVENHGDDVYPKLDNRNARFAKDPFRTNHALPFGYQGDNNKWAASTHRNAWIATGRIATPGTRPQSPSVRPSKTVVAQDVIINEIGNSANTAYDWVEFHNTTDSAKNVKNWRLSYVYNDAGKGKEIKVMTFPDKDINIPAKGYLVVAASHPNNSGNDLAAGIDFSKGKDDQPLKGLGEKGDPNANYLVVENLNIPDQNRSALFILRRTNDDKKLGTVHDIEDVVGTLYLRLHQQHPAGWTGHNPNREVFYSTEVWPLQNWEKGHGNVIDAGDEDFRAGKVYKRNGKNSGIWEKHAGVHGYTGIGYDRHAPVNAENGGTPGYANDAVKGEKSDWMGQVTISEIMLPTETDTEKGQLPRATRLPQWFEIYNSSMTEAVDLKDWYLEIQNDESEDFSGHRHGYVRLQNVVIQPNQTVLVVSASGLNSGDFPVQRTINIFTNSGYRAEFGMVNRGDSILNPEGFYIQLRDKKNNHVDEVGNYGVSHGDTRTTGVGRRYTTADGWDVPDLHSPEGHRTSLIRVYNNGVANSGLLPVADGTIEDKMIGWRRASDTNFRNVPGVTFYGNQNDYGTPGYRGGGPLPVSLSKFRPERLKETGEIVIRWITESELNNAGFNILRSETRNGEFTKINTSLIKGHGTTSERNTYEWKDTTAKPNVVYYYQIQDVSLDGQVQTLRQSRLKGNVTAAVKATTTWGEIKALQ